ncbi:MAG: hypothetical protein ACKVVT_04915 [Dehalococcoidia bacterium]
MIPRRIEQFIAATKLPAPADDALAARFLDGALLDLFRNQHPRDIVHSAATARWLVDRGHQDLALIQAALLHDVGKGMQRRGDRAAWVVAKRAGLGAHLASERSRFELRRALARTASHSQTSAAAMRHAGAEPPAVQLTLLHHTRQASDPMLTLLQAADAAS